MKRFMCNCFTSYVPVRIVFAHSLQWWIQDFPEGAPTPEGGSDNLLFSINSTENCMKMKKMDSEGVRGTLVPPLVCDQSKEIPQKTENNKAHESEWLNGNLVTVLLLNFYLAI